jgi:hypothetical protein
MPFCQGPYLHISPEDLLSVLPEMLACPHCLANTFPIFLDVRLLSVGMSRQLSPSIVAINLARGCLVITGVCGVC